MSGSAGAKKKIPVKMKHPQVDFEKGRRNSSSTPPVGSERFGVNGE